MDKSIQYFTDFCIRRFMELQEAFFNNPSDIASYVYGLDEELRKLGVAMIKESIELIDETLCKNGRRKDNWQIEKHVRKQLITSLGNVDFSKTLFTHKETGEMKYLVDSLMDIEPHQRITEDAMARIYEEVAQTSYRKAGKSVSYLDDVSKQTVKRMLHQTQFPKQYKKPAKKREVPYLYIDADEDHVSLQFQEKKGDLKRNEYGRKNNCIITKLIYVYEGIEPEKPGSKRNRLIKPFYFSRVCDGKENEKLWDEVYEYMDTMYDLSKVKKIYLNADGGGWIQTGKRRIQGIVTAVDEFHMQKYITKMVAHTKDSRDDAKAEIYAAIRKGTKEDFAGVVDRLIAVAEESEHKKIIEGANYILNNWSGAKTRLIKRAELFGCSAEGHVSHVLSARMSSRPLGWSKTGAAAMAQLRAYYWNKGNMLELARYQKEEVPMAARAERLTLSAAEIYSDIRAGRSIYEMQLGKYVEAITHTYSIQSRNKAQWSAHKWIGGGF